MFWEFLTFELKFRLKSLSTYVYFAIWFLMGFLTVAAEDFGPVGNGKVLLNGPWAISMLQVQCSLFGIIVIAAIFGTSALRDFQRDTYQLIFTKPVTKSAYLGGRWAGSFLISVGIFSGIVLGQAAGTLAPWADHARIGHASLLWYLQPFLAITVVQILFLGSLFFCVAALSRKLFVVYLQGVAFFMVYLVGQTVFIATRSLERFWSSILDPAGLILFNNLTKYWTVAEQNSRLLPWRGAFLYNRLLWAGVGLLCLGLLWRLFPMSVEALTARTNGRRAARLREQEAGEARPARSFTPAHLPQVSRTFGPGAAWLQFLTLTRLRTRAIFHEIPFWAMAVLAAVFAIVNGHYAGNVAGAHVWPVTFLMLRAVEGGAVLFFFIVATLYAGELIWKERDCRFDGIHDGLPLGPVSDGASRLAALALVELALLTQSMACGVLMQTLAGYHHYEFLQYFKELYLLIFPQVMIFSLLAFFVHSLVPNKFMGHGIVIGSFLVQPMLSRAGLEGSLYLFGSTPPVTYSDMNGYGHFVQGQLWATIYWLSIALLLWIVALAFTRRGSDLGWRLRLRAARGPLRRFAPALALCLLAALGSGFWFFYNTHVLNEFLSAKDQRDIQIDYERQFKKYEGHPQPKVIAVTTEIDLFPERRSFDGQGHFTLQNKTAGPIQEIHLTESRESVSDVRFDRPFRRTFQAPRDLFAIYRLDTPLQPGDLLHMDFRVHHTARGFKDGNERPEMALNGMFFDQSYFPSLGYSSQVELSDPRRRTEAHLPPLEDMPPRGDERGGRTNLFAGDADWITYHAVVSTSPDQIAVAPGYLKREWRQNGRRYFEYDMGATRIQNFHAYISGRYQVKKVQHGDVSIEVYHDPAHPYDVDDMVDAARAGLDYCQKNYSPFQFTQYRILEFPRYRAFAQSFPNTVPFSEDMGFIGRMRDEDDIDFTYFVVAHELAHQWWGHQLIGGNVQGSNMMSEALAEYTALRVMAKRYGEANMRKFLKRELDGYLRGRSGETRSEAPLGLVQRESYVWYQKGSLVLYALSDYIGEDKLNEALRGFLLEHRYANADSSRSGPYPDTRQLVQALLEKTPPELRYYVTDAFESIVLYDNKALSATVAPAPGGKFKVTLEVQARKLKADGNGLETPMPLDDVIEIGVFKGRKGKEQPLHLEKVRLTRERRTFEFLVNEKPTRAGIDPFNKLIDRNSEDNLVEVTGP
jgi:ABC-type transport system involved in multi-copper enzyme maturation permease subunit